jgi:DNA-binding winged helix-turn-helix (wHTH) protein/predicted ATPase
MPTGTSLRFGRYRFDAAQGLTRGAHEVRLTPKSLAVLQALLERSGEIVTKEELFRSVWPDTAVSDAALTSCIQELRRALADDARHPRFIETVHRRGFRFVAQSSADEPIERRPDASPDAPRPIVGRETAMAQLCEALTRARAGRRQVVFVTGEAGIGKTALVDLFLDRLEGQSPNRVVRGACVEHHGAGEAYQPLLDALGRLGLRPDGEFCLSTLRRCAPTWLAQLAMLQTTAERQALRRRTSGITPERMLRELTDALETMATRSPIVLCLEDLHWSDVSTLDWINAFARRRDTTDVLLIATYRLGIAGGAPAVEALADDLVLGGLCERIALPRLDAHAVDAYVAARFPPADEARSSLAQLAAAVHRQTDGNPLFVVNALTDLAARQILTARGDRWLAAETVDTAALGMPADVRRAIERQIDRLSEPERRLLEIASVTAATCPAAAVAAAAGSSTADVETTLAALARRHVFVRQGPTIEWPDGTISATFEFLHSLYQDVFSTRLPPSGRVTLLRTIGARLETAYGARAAEIAAELAYYFEDGRDFPRAVIYRQQAAETDRQRSAHRLARDHYRHALTLLEKLPPGDARDEREVALRTGLGSVVMQTEGWAAPEVEAAYARVRELSQARPASRPLQSALWNLWIFHAARGDLADARSLADRLFELAGDGGDRELLLQAHHARWSTLFALGDLSGTEHHAREGIRLHDDGQDATLAYGSHDAGICARLFCARVLALGGRTETAAAMCRDALTRARELDHPFTLAFALMHAAAIHETRRDAAASHAHAAEATHVAREHGLALMLAWAKAFLGWATAHLGDPIQGMSMLADAVEAARATGSVLFQPHVLGLLAEVQAMNGFVGGALLSIDEAFTIGDRTGERFYAAELYRLRGQLRLLQDRDVDHRLPADDFLSAVRIAGDQGAHQLALRAAASLATLRDKDGDRAASIRLLIDARGRVAEGRQLPDLLEADALIVDAGPREGAR